MDAPIFDPSIYEKTEGPTFVSASTLDCRKLSKPLCNKTARCTYNDTDKICMPSNIEAFSKQYFESKSIWRTNVNNWLENAGCNLTEYIENAAVFTGKESASSSVILSGTIKPTAFDKVGNKSNVIMKITYDAHEVFNNSLEVEIAIYKNIITRLVNERITPHVTSYLGFVKCDKSVFTLPNEAKPDYVSQEGHIDARDYNTNKLNILFTERSTGVYLDQWISTATTLKDILSVIFQVLYTLYCFSRIGLKHNDLHFRNIFVEDVGTPIKICYVRSPTQYIELTTRYIVKIYDWDRGSTFHPAVPLNLELTAYFCEEYGTCDSYTPKFDMFMFVAYLHQFYSKKFSPDVMKEIKMKWIVKILSWSWYSNIVSTRERSHSLRYKEDPTDNQFNTPANILQIFVDADWSEKPFEIKSGSTDALPKEIVFTPPPKLMYKIEEWQPVSTDTHEYKNISGIAKFKEKTVDIVNIWITDNKLDGKSYNTIKNIITEIAPGLYYEDIGSYAGIMLLPEFYRLTKQDKLKLFGPDFMQLVDNVWSKCGGVLPAKIKRPMLVPI